MRLLRPRRLGLALLASSVAATAAGCGAGASGPGATALLRDTFAQRHEVTSGRLFFSLSVAAAGARRDPSPVSVTLTGPFQTRGAGRPESDFTLTIDARGQRGSLQLVSTGQAGYLTLAGASFSLPASSFAKLESGLPQTAQPGSASAVGLDPLGWLTDPVLAGHASIGGTPTTRIRARVDPAALVRELGPLLSSTGSLATAGPGASATAGGATASPGASATALSAAARARIAAAIRNAGLDVWTGTRDHTLRRLILALTLPVTGALSDQLAGVRSARLELEVQYSHLDQPQRITAPAHPRPLSELEDVLASVIAGSGSSTTPAATGTSTTPSATLGGVQMSAPYRRCLTAAGGNIAKLQRCAPLIDGGSGR